MGREARLLPGKQDHMGAIELYLLQYLDGSPDTLSSLTWSAQFVIVYDDPLDAYFNLEQDGMPRELRLDRTTAVPLPG